MTIEEFVNGFNSASDKEKYVKKHIVRTYVPYEEKVARCQRIIDNSMYVNNDDMRRFRPNTPLRYELFIIVAMQCYTDVVFDVDDTLKGFNILAECGAYDYVVKYVQSDLAVFNSTLEMMVDDVIDLERNYVDYIDTKIDAILDLFKNIIEASNALNQEDT